MICNEVGQITIDGIVDHEDPIRCEVCGVIIGNYFVGKRKVRTTYQLPICINCYDSCGKKGQHIVDWGCFETLRDNPQYRPKFDALDDPDMFGEDGVLSPTV